MASLFTKIINGELPSYKVYEDDNVFCFLDIFPIHLGHTLIVPKKEVDYFVDLDEPHYSAVFQTAKKIAPALKSATDCVRVGTAVLGFEVPHFHYHLVPMWNLADLDFAKKVKVDPEQLEAMQQKILSALD